MKIAKLRITRNGKLTERRPISINVKVGDRVIGDVVVYDPLEVVDFYDSMQDKL